MLKIDKQKVQLSIYKDGDKIFGELFFNNYSLNKETEFNIDITPFENRTLECVLCGKELFYKEKLIKVYDNVFKKNSILNLTVEDGVGRICIGDYVLDAFESDLNRRNYKVNVQNDENYTIVRYANLHQHTENSLLDGIVRILELAEKSEYACAITDHGNMFGWFDMLNAFNKQSKKAIIGEEFYLETLGGPRLILPKDLKATDEEELMFDNTKQQNPDGLNGEHLIVLAKDNDGIKNLFWLSSQASNHFYRKPHITFEELKSHSKGLIVCSACIASGLNQFIKEYLKAKEFPTVKEWIENYGELFYLDPAFEETDNIETNVYIYNHKKSREWIDWFLNVFKDDFYLEFQDHHFPLENAIMDEMVRIRNNEYPNIKIVATCDAHYLNKEDAYVHELFLCNQTKRIIDDPKHMKFSGDGYYVHTSKEMLELFPIEYLDNTLEIEEKIHYEPLNKGYHLPHFPLPEGFKDDNEYFKFLVNKTFKEKFPDKFKNPIYRERIKTEGKTIQSMGWASYFLIVMDFIKWAEDNNVKDRWQEYFPNKKLEEVPQELLKDYKIYCGSGRGSGAGSLINACLGITKVDPILYDLSFERFLNPDRISMPDIDTDIEDSQRGKVLDYVRFKYGYDKVANIITFGTCAAKNSIKTINRVLGYSVANGEAITKLIPEKPGMKIKTALENADFKRLYDTNADAKKIVDLALRIEGLKTSQSIHPCFIAGTKILTNKGEKPIEEITTEDTVLTHTGEFHRVIKTMSRKAFDDTYIIEAEDKEPVICTYNHPFYSITDNSEQPEWIEVKDLKAGVHYVGIPIRSEAYRNDKGRKVNKCYYKWSPVLSVRKLEAKEREVFNLEVEKDHSYIANHIAVHNCASLITDEAITTYMPKVQMEDPETKEKVWVTQMEGPTCEELGCLKMDFLGLRTLGYVHETIENIKQNTGKDIDYDNIPLDDMKVYQYLYEGNTPSVFQCESDMFTTVIKKTLKDYKTAKGDECFDRLVAMNALVRPGSNVFIDDFADRILHPEKIEYLVPQLEPILKNTYGIILYQEQTMRITRDLAGFSAGQSDTIRKGLAKKKKYIIDEYRDYFIHGNKKKKIKGCVENGISEKKATELWDIMAMAASYSFNKSHAVAYSMHSIRTAWLSYYYPYEYMTAVLNSFSSDTERLAKYLDVARKKRMNILPPSVNNSKEKFTTDGKNIQVGISGIKGINAIASDIIDERTKNGLYSDLHEFVNRMMVYKNFSKRTLVSLIYAGMLDGWCGSRLNKLNQIDVITTYIKKTKDYQKKLTDGKTHRNLQEPILELLEDTVEMDKLELLIKEKEYTGMYISGNPMDLFKSYIGKCPDCSTVNETSSVVCGIVQDVQKKVSKKGTSFYTFKLENNGTISGILNSKNGTVEDGEVVKLEGKISKNEFGINISVNNIENLAETKKIQENRETVYVNIPDTETARAFMNIKFDKGNKRLIAVYKGKERLYENISIGLDMSEKIKNLVGQRNINFKR